MLLDNNYLPQKIYFFPPDAAPKAPENKDATPPVTEKDVDTATGRQKIVESAKNEYLKAVKDAQAEKDPEAKAQKQQQAKELGDKMQEYYKTLRSPEKNKAAAQALFDALVPKKTAAQLFDERMSARWAQRNEEQTQRSANRAPQPRLAPRDLGDVDEGTKSGAMAALSDGKGGVRLVSPDQGIGGPRTFPEGTPEAARQTLIASSVIPAEQENSIRTRLNNPATYGVTEIAFTYVESGKTKNGVAKKEGSDINFYSVA